MHERDEQVLVHLSGPLKAAFREFARADGRSISAYTRQLMVDHAVQKVAETATHPPTAAGALRYDT